MSSSYPPPAPLPPRRNDTWLAVIVGILIVLVVIVGFGVFVIARFVSHTHIQTTGSGAHQVTTIQSPLGNLHVQGDGNTAHVSIQSPFGDVKVNPTPDLSRLDMSVYAGATEVTSREDSVFDGNGGHGFGDLGVMKGVRFGGPGAEVAVESGDRAILVNVAEFRTSAAISAVLAYYQKQLERFGTVEHHWNGEEESLKVKLSPSNVREVAVRNGPDGTHFVLVRVEGGASAR